MKRSRLFHAVVLGGASLTSPACLRDALPPTAGDAIAPASDLANQPRGDLRQARDRWPMVEAPPDIAEPEPELDGFWANVDQWLDDLYEDPPDLGMDLAVPPDLRPRDGGVDQGTDARPVDLARLDGAKG